MLFSSYEFIFFLPIVFVLYWVFKKNRILQNIILLIASYVFYGWWDWRFLVLLIFLSLSNFSLGILIGKFKNRKRLALMIGLIINLGALVYFKYFNFFISGFNDLISLVGYTIKSTTINIILPLGISFYTFLSISYLLDVYKNKVDANKNIIEVLLSLSFFPIILSGPIERPITLMPQFRKKRNIDYNKLTDGMRQILWGLFTKVVIADGLAGFTDGIFNNYSSYNGSTLLFGAIMYSIQIYADFSGYSDIAIGVAKLFGIKIMRNFAYPYFSRDITIFWKRWHISLTKWFRDYVFLPVAYSVSRKIKSEKVALIKTDYIIYIVGILITWLLTGLWHGANYTFILWGLFHGFLLIIYHLQKKPRKKYFKKIGISNNNKIIVGVESFLTILLVVISWIFFKSNSISQAFIIINKIFSSTLISSPALNSFNFIILIYIFIYIIIEWIQREKDYGLDIKGAPLVVRWTAYILFAVLISTYWGSDVDFIYFQF